MTSTISPNSNTLRHRNVLSDVLQDFTIMEKLWEARLCYFCGALLLDRTLVSGHRKVTTVVSNLGCANTGVACSYWILWGEQDLNYIIIIFLHL